MTKNLISDIPVGYFTFRYDTYCYIQHTFVKFNKLLVYAEEAPLLGTTSMFLSWRSESLTCS